MGGQLIFPTGLVPTAAAISALPLPHLGTHYPFFPRFIIRRFTGSIHHLTGGGAAGGGGDGAAALPAPFSPPGHTLATVLVTKVINLFPPFGTVMRREPRSSQPCWAFKMAQCFSSQSRQVRIPSYSSSEASTSNCTRDPLQR